MPRVPNGRISLFRRKLFDARDKSVCLHRELENVEKVMVFKNDAEKTDHTAVDISMWPLATQRFLRLIFIIPYFDSQLNV